MIIVKAALPGHVIWPNSQHGIIGLCFYRLLEELAGLLDLRVVLWTPGGYVEPRVKGKGVLDLLRILCLWAGSAPSYPRQLCCPTPVFQNSLANHPKQISQPDRDAFDPVLVVPCVQVPVSCPPAQLLGQLA